MRTSLVVVAVFVAMAGCKKEKEAPDFVLDQALEDDNEAFGSTLDASEAAIEGPSSFAPDSGSSFAGCTGTISGTDVIAVCARNVPSNRSITWSCTGVNGNGVVGSASIMTTVVDDTDCPNVTIDHDITFLRTWTAGNYRGELTGTSSVRMILDVMNRSAQRSVTANMIRQVFRDDEMIRDQELTGTRVADLQANGPGLADDTRTVDGGAMIEFKLADAELELAGTDVLWTRDCCHPVGGSVVYAFSGDWTGDGTITFGPTCGEATDDGEDFGLRACLSF